MKTSKKKYMILTLGLATKQEGLTANKLILVTSLGLITGTPVLPDNRETADPECRNDSRNSKEFATELISRLSEDFSSATGTTDEEISEDDGFVLMQDVTIKTSSACFALPVLAVFYDQITGATIGNI